MARFSRIKTILVLEETGLVPTFYYPDIEICKKLITACYEGGARVVEFTNRGDHAHEVFASISSFTEKTYPDMILGAGTIMDAPTAILYIQLGANFLVSPILDEQVGRLCNSRKVLWIPGCGSATEISRAEQLGAEIIKIFPGTSVGGPAFVKSYLGPSPWTYLMPTGDVEPTESCLREWFEAGVFCAGMGNKLITDEAIKSENFKSISTNISTSRTFIKMYRKKFF